MPRVSNIEVLQKNEQPTVFIRARTPLDRMPALIGESYGKMAAYLKEAGRLLADVPFVLYHNMDMQDMDVEMAFPLAAPLPGRGDIKAGCVPAGKVVFCMYRGPYTDLEATYEEMAAWIEASGYKATGAAYEHYYNGLEFPESEHLTMIAMPVE